MIRERDSRIDYLTKELDIIRRKKEKQEEEIKDLEEQLHRVNRAILDKNAAEAQLESSLKMQKDKNSKLLQEIMMIQAEHKGTLHKVADLEDQCNEYKDKIYWLESNREKNKLTSEQL